MEDLGDFCSRNGYEDFAKYARQSCVQNVLMELTEAIIKNRPDDPKQFLIDMIAKELPTLAKQDRAVIPIHRMIRLFEATRNIAAEIVPRDTIDVIIRETIRLLNCDRVSVFAYDKRIGMLLLTASNLTKPIRVNPGQGIAGYVFTTKQQVNIPDCYLDSRFDSKFDKMTGYRTQSMIVMPIVDHEDNALGVLQAINKFESKTKLSVFTDKNREDGTEEKEVVPFGETDAVILGHLTQLVGVALRNAEVYREAIIASERSQGLLAMLSSLSQDLGAQSTILTVTMHAQQLVLADKCIVFMVDGRKDQLWSVAADTNREIRINRADGLVGACAMTKEVINCASAKNDPVHDSKMDTLVNCEIETMLCVPVMSKEGKGADAPVSGPTRKSMAAQPSEESKVIAVITLINKREFDDVMTAFDDEDISILVKFSKFVGDKLSDSSFIKDAINSAPKATEGDAVFGNLGQLRTASGGGNLGAPSRSNKSTAHSIFKPDAFIEEESGSEDELTRKRMSCPGTLGKPRLSTQR